MANSQAFFCQLAMENAFPACQSCCMAKSAKKISYRFKDLREQADLTLEQLSEGVEISVRTVLDL